MSEKYMGERLWMKNMRVKYIWMKNLRFKNYEKNVCGQKVYG